jgi:uncharacterized membrane protein YphA (DoxX/SURF4 family)
MRDELFLAGRIIFSLVFLIYGVRHLTQTEGSAQYAAYKKVPAARLMVQLTGVAMLVGGLAVVVGVWMDLAAAGLALFAVVAGVVMHRYWDEADPQARAGEMAQFWKNISLAGGALILLSVSEDAPYTVTDGLF